MRNWMITSTKKLAILVGGSKIRYIFKNKFMYNCYNAWLAKLVKPEEMIEVQNNKMFLDKNDSLGLSFRHIWEPYLTELFNKYTTKDSVVLDVGAHIGYFSIIAGRNAQKVYAIEPDLRNFTILNKNIEINNIKNIEAINVAVGEKNEKIKLYLHDVDTAGNRAFDSGEKLMIPVDCDMITIDSLNIPKVDLMKIDIEGFELKALIGMKETLKRSNGIVILTEFYPYLLDLAGTPAIEYYNFLKECGFRLYDIVENEHKLVEFDDKRLEELSNPEIIRSTNILCIRGELK